MYRNLLVCTKNAGKRLISKHRRVRKLSKLKISNVTFKNVNDYLQKNVCTHIILKNSINDRIRKLFIKFHAFIDLDASGKAFINRKFAQSLNLDFIALKIPRSLETFDESKTICGFITHYVEIYFKTSLVKEGACFIRFYVIDLFH